MSEETLRMMKDQGVWLSLQPLLNDEDAFSFDDPFSTRKWIQVTDATDKIYSLAKEIGVKMGFGTDMLFDPATAEKQGKFLAKLKRWFLALCGPRNPYQEGALGVIEEGAYADLIVVDGNPLEDIDLIANPEKNFMVIMKDGKVYKNTHFEKALELSRAQGARSLELRASTSLARARHRRGESTRARRLLEPLLESFAQGRGTRDLLDAARVLEALRPHGEDG